MNSIPEFTFEYNQGFPQWDFSINQSELSRFNEEYGTLDLSPSDDSQKKMFNVQTLTGAGSPQLIKSPPKKSYSLRK
ncbi:unnamed protein product [Moneuplotes crassus]|nr:unnamed protein product [Moneuplotes crassus]